MNNGKICVSVCAETAQEFSENIKRAQRFADFVELRFDCLDESEIKKVEFKYDENYIRTFRPREQGGKRDLSLKEREDFWNSGEDYCGGDFEEDIIENAFGWLYKPVICSHHDFVEVPKNLFEIYERLRATEADILKIAVQA
ncbi:MAG TPA: type I 3-dehydroquinate dehydratase, partial [Pyrinomonadaceae bacterium]|nr:type I 3-dehydroquinate dehydratase [Pyrinomonadaceae bacterium]